MIQINNVALFSSDFKHAMHKLLTTDKLEISNALRMQALALELEKKLLQARKDWVALADELIELDEQGNYSVKDGDFVWKNPENAVENKQRIEEFGTTLHEIDAPKFELKYFNAVGLSPTDLSVMSGFFKSPEQPKKLKLV